MKKRLYDQTSDLEQAAAAQLAPETSTAAQTSAGTSAEGETKVRVRRGKLRLYGQVPEPDSVATARAAPEADRPNGDNHGER